MDYPAVQAVLDDLPTTFKRPDQLYRQLVDLMSNGLYRYTQAADGTSDQMDFFQAQYGWLDVWGQLFGDPRAVNEPDLRYIARIIFEVNAGKGTPLQIVRWIGIVFNVTAQVVENFPDVGYQIIFPATLTSAQIQTIMDGLVYVRPAGVPITGISQASLGTYLETINFFNAEQVVGAYLSGALVPVAYTLKSSTNNALPTLPDLFLTDPTLNPNLPPTG